MVLNYKSFYYYCIIVYFLHISSSNKNTYKERNLTPLYTTNYYFSIPIYMINTTYIIFQKNMGKILLLKGDIYVYK